MTYYEIFSDGYENARIQAQQRREDVINKARALAEYRTPLNSAELLADGDGEYDLELNWVEVASPWSSDPDNRITVRPTLTIADGSPADTQEKDVYDSGAYQLLIEGRLPDGQDCS